MRLFSNPGVIDGSFYHRQEHPDQGFVTLTERKTRFALLCKIERHTAELLSMTIIELLQPILDRVHTITADNGKEFADHQWIAEVLKANFYFAHPFSAWGGGENENTNGLVRQYFPKSYDLNNLSDFDLLLINKRRNYRPRKFLDYQSPFEVLLDSYIALVT